MYRRPRGRAVKDMEFKGFAIIPYYNSMSGREGRLLWKAGIQTIYQLTVKIGQRVESVKDDLKQWFPNWV